MNRALMKQCLDAMSPLQDLIILRQACDALKAELAKPEPEIYGYVSEHNCTGPFKHQFHLTLETIYPDNCKSITPVYTKGTTNA